MATADVSQVSILVVVDAESPVCLHGGEAVITRLQGINPDGARVHAAEKQLSVGAAKHQELHFNHHPFHSKHVKCKQLHKSLEKLVCPQAT